MPSELLSNHGFEHGGEEAADADAREQRGRGAAHVAGHHAEHLDDRARLKDTVRAATGMLEVRGATTNNLRDVDVDIPLGVLVVLTGVAGSGKSSLIDGSVTGRDGVVSIDQGAIKGSRRSNPATYTGLLDPIRKAFAKANGVKPALFSANSEGACPTCNGAGVIYTDLAIIDVLPDGLAFSIPNDDAAPPAFDVPGDARDQIVVLAVPDTAIGKVAHGTQEHGNALLGRPYMGGLFGYLRHPDYVLGGIETLQRGRLRVELVAQHDNEVAYFEAVHGVVLVAFLARQASEQYSTDSQFLAQALRHVMVRPHTAHSLLGRLCLLPLKSFFM